MTRHNPTRLLALVLLIPIGILVLTAAGQPTAAQSPPPRPNIVVVVIDDMRWDDMGIAGHPFAETPNIDRVAREGARFTNAFATTPLCSPSRGNLLTGLYAHTSGIVDNVERGPASHQLDTFPRMLQRAGYDTAFIGKWHMGNDDTPRPGWDYWLSMKGQGQLFDPPLNENGERKIIKGYITDIFADKAAEFIEKPRTKPFLVYLPHKAIHPDLTVKLPEGQQALVSGGFLAAPRHEGRYATAKVPRRPNYGVIPTDKPALMRTVEGVTPIGPDTVTPDETIRDRLEMLLSIDDGLGKMLGALERTGKLDDTIVVFTSDHGYFYGEHGLNAERRFAYEESIRIPLVARYPKLIKPGTIPDQLTLTIDLAPTLLELGRAPVPQELQGRSLVPLLAGGRAKEWRTSILIEHQSDPESYLGRGALRRALNMGYKAVRTERYKYIQYTELSGMDELYDLQSDPYEMKNLFTGPQNARTLQEMRDELARLLRSTGVESAP